MKKSWITIIVLIIIILLVIGFYWYWNTQRNKDTDAPKANLNTNISTTNTSAVKGATDMDQLEKLSASPIATVETNFGTFTMKFYSTDAPELTKNFIELAKTGYYDGLTFHRIIPGFVAQGGDPNGTGTGGHSYKGEGQGLADEPGALALKHLRGSVAWAKSSLPNSIGSQFYVALDALTQLDGGYSVFGQVVDGMDVVDKIAGVKTDTNGMPEDEVKIVKVTIAE
jgi:cyclophilin family peptidyl-prolyl cis-trans isomerase